MILNTCGKFQSNAYDSHLLLYFGKNLKTSKYSESMSCTFTHKIVEDKRHFTQNRVYKFLSVQDNQLLFLQIFINFIPWRN